MASKEKGRRGADPIPNFVCQDKPECTEIARVLQVSQLTRRCALTAAMAAVVAPMIYGEARQ